MKKVLVFLLLCTLICSGIKGSTADTEVWWSDDYNYRIPIIQSSNSEPGTVTISFQDILDKLGIYPFDPTFGFIEKIDPMSLILIEQGTASVEHPFYFEPTASVAVDDFESGIAAWNAGSSVSVNITEIGEDSSLHFYKDTASGVKIYIPLAADMFKEMDYLSFDAKGSFRITLRDPAKGTFIVDAEVHNKNFSRQIIPLEFDTFREGITYYLELYPLDFVSNNWIDDIVFINDIVNIDFPASSDKLYLYFNTYISGENQGSPLFYPIDGAKKQGILQDPEGFRISFENEPFEAISNNYDIVVQVSDARNNIEWIRYRIDWPSWVDFDDTSVGVWGDLSFDGTYWNAVWDTRTTICDGHHTLAVMACDIKGNKTFQLIEIEVENIVDGINLAPDKESFSFAVVGDMQPLAGGMRNPLVASYIMDTISNKEDIDFIVQVGDLAYAGHKGEYEQIRRQLTSLATVPFYPAIGNHDAAAASGIDNFVYHFGHKTYSFDYGTSHFIFLCSELPGYKGLIAGEQLEWLDRDLAQNSDKDAIFIVIHQPIYPVFHGIINQEEVQDVIERYDNVAAIFQGHEHTYNYEAVNGMDIFITGGATWQDGQYAKENTFNHYFIFEVSGAAITWRVEKTSHLFLETPGDGEVTNNPTIKVAGTTQPYTVVFVNGIECTSTARGDYSVVVPLELGPNTITVSSDGLPDGQVHSDTHTIVRLAPLEIEVLGDEEPLEVLVTSAGQPIEGISVQLLDMEITTGSDGKAIFENYPTNGNDIKISAYGAGYYGTFTTISISKDSGELLLAYGAIIVAVMVLAVIGAIIKKKK
ncbi:MAG: metallophosphoesterase [Candidatus Methanofastidiosia archaeon]